MKIGIVLSKCHWYGSSRYVLETSQYFTKKGHEVHIFANSFDTVDNDKIIFHKVPAFSSNYLIREGLVSLFETILLKLHSFDVTFAQPTRYFSPDVAEVQFVFKRWVDYKKNNGMKIDLDDRILPFIEKHNVKKAKNIIALSNSVKEDLIKYYNVPAEKIHVVYSGVNAEEFNPENRKKYREEIRKIHGISPDDFLILFVGNPYGRKGLEFVIRALAKIKQKNVKLLVSGRDEPGEFQSIITQLGLDKRVIFRIGLSTNINKYFSAADVFVLPSLYETFGLVVIEAMASGLPVMVSDSNFVGASELIEDGKDGILLKDPKDFEAIAEKLKILIESENARKQIGKEANNKARKYTWERTADCMLKVLEEAAKI
jgi:UDP-glucose:(heptosyl)LPS alpha-1,3-glucosyltransferase